MGRRTDTLKKNFQKKCGLRTSGMQSNQKFCEKILPANVGQRVTSNILTQFIYQLSHAELSNQLHLTEKNLPRENSATKKRSNGKQKLFQ